MNNDYILKEVKRVAQLIKWILDDEVIKKNNDNDVFHIAVNIFSNLMSQFVSPLILSYPERKNEIIKTVLSGLESNILDSLQTEIEIGN